MTVGVPGTNGSDRSNIEVNNIIKWSKKIACRQIWKKPDSILTIKIDKFL